MLAYKIHQCSLWHESIWWAHAWALLAVAKEQFATHIAWFGCRMLGSPDKHLTLKALSVWRFERSLGTTLGMQKVTLEIWKSCLRMTSHNFIYAITNAWSSSQSDCRTDSWVVSPTKWASFHNNWRGVSPIQYLLGVAPERQFVLPTINSVQKIALKPTSHATTSDSGVLWLRVCCLLKPADTTIIRDLGFSRCKMVPAVDLQVKGKLTRPQQPHSISCPTKQTTLASCPTPRTPSTLQRLITSW